MALCMLIAHLSEAERRRELYGRTPVRMYLEAPFTWPGHMLESVVYGRLRLVILQSVIAGCILILQYEILFALGIRAMPSVLIVGNVAWFVFLALVPDCVKMPKNMLRAWLKRRRAANAQS